MYKNSAFKDFKCSLLEYIKYMHFGDGMEAQVAAESLESKDKGILRVQLDKMGTKLIVHLRQTTECRRLKDKKT